jgi:hypothetical protein
VFTNSSFNNRFEHESSLFEPIPSKLTSSSARLHPYAPPRRVLRRLPPQPPLDPALSVAGDQRVVSTRQWALRCLVRVWAKRRFFWPISAVFGRPALILRLGGAGVGACTTRAAFRLLGLFPPLLAACFLGDLCFNVLCFFSFFGSQSACVWVQFLWEYFVG